MAHSTDAHAHHDHGAPDQQHPAGVVADHGAEVGDRGELPDAVGVAREQVADVEELLGVRYRTIQNWVAWYRTGGLAEVLRRITGHGSVGARAYLNPVQQRALVAKVQLGEPHVDQRAFLTRHAVIGVEHASAQRPDPDRVEVPRIDAKHGHIG